MIEMKRERDTLNLIRWISTLAIVVCHLLQGHNNDFAYVFNTGVQVFFILSGFLYGSKQIQSVRQFYTKRILKLYVPFFIWVLFSSVLLFIYVPECVTLKGIVCQVAMRSNLPGLSHLWFMKVIFICYLILPLVDSMLKRNVTLTIICVSTFICIALSLTYNPFFIWVAIYYIGFCMGRYRRILPYMFAISLIFCIAIFSSYQWSFKVFLGFSMLSGVVHSTVGLCFFIGMLYVGNAIHFHKRISQILAFRGGTKYI